MTPPGERSIRNISVGHRKHPKHPHDAEDADERDLSPDGPSEIPHRRPRRRKNRFWVFSLAVVAVCAVLGTLLSTVFAGATITVTPRIDSVTLPATLQAAPNAPTGVLPYQTVTVTRSSSITVPAQGSKKVSRPASGVITISNAYGSASQRLIANTRFEASDGKIYRIHDSVTVPGSSGSKPGTVSATIYADSPGPDYNKAAGATFTIPGFKGDPRYAKFTALSEGAIAGGFIGDEPAIATADLASAKATLQQKVDADARAAAAGEIPDGSVAIPGTLEVVFSDLVQAAGPDKTATLTESATASGIIVRQGDLAAAIARKTVQNYQGEALQFVDVSAMDVSLASSSKRSDGTITLALKGQASLVWQFDPNALSAALVGKSKGEFQSVIDTFRPAITKADATVKPFWQGKFPDDAQKITVKISGNK